MIRCASSPPACSERRRTVVFVCMCLLISLWAAPVRPGIVLGESMNPQFHTGQIFLASRKADPELLHCGDVVLAEVDGQSYLKRVYALGGQTVWVMHSGDGTADYVLAEERVRSVREAVARYPGLGQVLEFEVPSGHVFLLGDARQSSYDSRHFGPVPTETIRGKVVVPRLFQLWSVSGEREQLAMAEQ